MVYVLALALLIHIVVLSWLYAGVRHTMIPSVSSGCGVTIIIVFKNERLTLPACLQAIAGQNHNQPIQVILVDDGSTDGSTVIAEQFIRGRIGWSLLRREGAPNWASTKKESLQMAARHADHELLLFTDADCVPPPTWVNAMVRSFSNQIALVAGFSPQQTSRSAFWSEIFFLDSLSASLVAAGTIGRQIAVTCTGRNLAFRKSSWQASGGYVALPDTLSGDDDFVLQAISRQGKIRYCLSADAVVPAQGPDTLTAFLHQKKRHLSSGRQYRLPAKLGYGFFHLNHSLLWISLAMAILVHPVYLLLFAGKLVVDHVVLSRFAGQFDMNFSRPAFIAWQMLFLFYNVSAAVTRHQPPRQWQETNRA